MALLFMDGFDNASSAYPNLKWSSSNGSFVFDDVSRTGGRGVQMSYSDYLKKLFSSTYSTLISGFAFKAYGTHTTDYFMAFLGSDSSDIVQVGLNSDGSLWIKNSAGTTICTSSTGLININTWYYLEIKATFHETAGTVDVLLNGVSIISETGLNTSNGSDNFALGVYITSISTSFCSFDDFYVCDTTGSVNNDFLGDVTIKALHPISDGNSSDFTPSTGTDHYALVDDNPLVNLDSYLESDTVGDKELFGMTVFPDYDNIFGVQVSIPTKNVDAGSLSIKPLCRSNSVDTEGDSLVISQTIQDSIFILEKEPVNDISWTTTSINAAEFGIKVQSKY